MRDEKPALHYERLRRSRSPWRAVCVGVAVGFFAGFVASILLFIFVLPHIWLPP